ncbi:type II toxin-antitoxin system RelE/ParE family toxin [Desulfocurvibacter africanus]|uniref:type II toxin-antitoxin system RelE/ParE family toxin n=1 Tax=Desulfocurvibacter africanus TaxID=873 RepID=UPI002FD89843
MDHNICLNAHCFPATDKSTAYDILLNAFFGLLELNQGDDRFFLYYDDQASNFIDDCQLAPEYTYADFLKDLLNSDHVDVCQFIVEIADKSPALDFLFRENEELFNTISNYTFYLPDSGLTSPMDTLSLAWFLDATLLSIPTCSHWDKAYLHVKKYPPDRYHNDVLPLRNISRFEHGRLLREYYASLNTPALEELCPICIFTDDFIHWLGNLDSINQYRIRDKLTLACARNFSGGEPLFKSLENAHGIREIRFSAYPGGAIRILFAQYDATRFALFLGFIKKSDNEGYNENIARAKILWDQLRLRLN